MIRKIVVLVCAVILLAPAVTGAVTPEDFKARTTQNLVNLCSATVGDPLAEEAVHFCEGYCVGAYHYYVTATGGQKENQWICLPDPVPSRTSIISEFIEWAKAHPEYANDIPVESIFRFLIEKYPCGK